jgi:hypothetical protein
MPNYSTAGSYCFLSQCIQLDSLELDDIKRTVDFALDSDREFEAAYKVAPLMNHEAKHWYDAHSTLWGMSLIEDIYSCRNDLQVAISSGISTKLDHFDRQRRLIDTIDFIKYPEFYTERNSKANTVKPWAYHYTCGQVFTKHGIPSDRHIFFTRFVNANGELIARAPFSLCAMLEASAVSQELTTKVLAIQAIDEPIEREMQKRKFEEGTVRELYDENLIEYSVVAHKVANAFSIVDVIEAYRIASQLCRVILNLPDVVIDRFRPDSILSTKYGPFVEPYISALKYRDWGGIFSLFVDALDSLYQQEGVNVTALNIEELTSNMLFEASGYKAEQIFQLSCDQVSRLGERSEFGDYAEYVKSTLELGAKLHKKFGLFGPSYINLDQELIPDHILGDGVFVSLRGAAQEEFENRYFDLSDYYRYLKNFSKACIV